MATNPGARRASEPEPQSARAVMMIRPARFLSNPETAATNAFQNIAEAPEAGVSQARALEEFEGLAAILSDAGVEVVIFDDRQEPHTPDAVFPNNWLSTHADGTVVLYPMLAENRRLERRADIIEHGLREAGFVVRDVIDLTHYEREGKALESTGSLILDRVNHIAYACLSPRTDPEAAAEFGRRLGYRVLSFDATGKDGQPIYHTNVMMSLGTRFAVLCADAIAKSAQADAVMASLRDTGHEPILIDPAQMGRFAGNVLELENAAGEKLLAMSSVAEAAFTRAQKAVIERHARIVAAPIDTIELCAGGSVRCMLAELHLPRARAGAGPRHG